MSKIYFLTRDIKICSNCDKIDIKTYYDDEKNVYEECQRCGYKKKIGKLNEILKGSDKE